MYARTLTYGVAGLASMAYGQLQRISNFGENPTGLTMDAYIPSTLSANPGLVLALHPCGGSGTRYAQMADYTAYASERDFVVVYPSSSRDFNCWDVATSMSLTRDGGGDSTGLANMLRYAIDTWGVDSTKSHVTGSSSGCMMTNVMIAAYPDFFASATCYSGVAAGCLSGSPGSSPISADPTCANGEIQLSDEEWAERARNMYPGYTGPYPSLKTLHGTADTLVFIPNLDQQLAQWSTIHAIELMSSNPNTPQSGYTELVYGDGTKLVGYSAEGVGHTVPVNTGLDIEWFGL